MINLRFMIDNTVLMLINNIKFMMLNPGLGQRYSI
jgi:hypothetical protein